MQKYFIGSFAALTLVLSACGGGGGSGDQAKVADMTMELSDESGIDLDRDCVEKMAAKLSDDDAKKLLEAGTEGDAELSAEGEALGDEMFSCVNMDTFVDSILAGLPDDGSIDRDCMREQLKDISDPNDIQSKATSAVVECMDLGG